MDGLDKPGHVLGKRLAQTGVDLVQRRRPVSLNRLVPPSPGVRFNRDRGVVHPFKIQSASRKAILNRWKGPRRIGNGSGATSYNCCGNFRDGRSASAFAPLSR